MPNLDDDRFEIYLKKFRPLPPALLSVPAPAESRAQGKHRSTKVLWTLAAAAAIVVALFLLRLPPKQTEVPAKTANLSGPAQLAPSQPLTLRAANQLLVNSASFEAALDSLEAESAATAIPKGKESALAVLSEENTKP